MKARMSLVVLLAVLACLGAASAASATPARRLLGGLGYIPQGCPLTVSVVAQESQPDWFWDQEAPEIRGSVTLSNPSTYSVPITNIIVQARSSDGMQYSTVAYCSGSTSTVVPFNPVPYTYGTVNCNYRLILDRSVFGSYGHSSSGRRLQGDGKIQVNLFPGSSSSSSSGGSSGSGGGYGYFPPPNQRPTWTVTAVATISYSNAQCLSAPTPVNTDCWWTWLASWHQKHHSWGRKLMGSEHEHSQHTQQSEYITEHEGRHQQHHMHVENRGVMPLTDSSLLSSSSGRALLGSQSQHTAAHSAGEHEGRHRQNRRWWFSGRSLLASLWGSGSSSERSRESHDEHRHEHQHHQQHHTMHVENRGVMPLTGVTGRALLGSESHQHSHEHSGHSGEQGGRHHQHQHHHRSELENRGVMPLTEPVSSNA